MRIFSIILMSLLLSCGDPSQKSVVSDTTGDLNTSAGSAMWDSENNVYDTAGFYNKGFKDAFDCFVLLNLELYLKGEKKTLGEMGEVCRQRLRISLER
jgi:hypothetical protein